jgi:hypothetical protein
MFEEEWHETYKDVQDTTIYFMWRIIITCRHFSYDIKYLPKKSKMLH